jgi:hypothetical protein
MTAVLMTDDWKQFAETLRQNGYGLLAAANPKLLVTDKGAADPNIIAASLLCRSLSHLKAIVLLLRSGLVVEARTLVRNCLENAFWLAAIEDGKERDDILRRMGEGETFSQRAMGEFAMKFRQEQGAAENPALRAALQKVKARKASSPLTPKDLSKLGAFESSYLFYQEYSRDAHPTLSALSRYLSRIVENGETIRCLDVVPPAREGDEFTIHHGCQAVLSAMFAANSVWEAGEAVHLTKLAEEYSSMAGLQIEPKNSGGLEPKA